LFNAIYGKEFEMKKFVKCIIVATGSLLLLSACSGTREVKTVAIQSKPLAVNQALMTTPIRVEMVYLREYKDKAGKMVIKPYIFNRPSVGNFFLMDVDKFYKVDENLKMLKSVLETKLRDSGYKLGNNGHVLRATITYLHPETDKGLRGIILFRKKVGKNVLKNLTIVGGLFSDFSLASSEYGLMLELLKNKHVIHAHDFHVKKQRQHTLHGLNINASDWKYKYATAVFYESFDSTVLKYFDELSSIQISALH